VIIERAADLADADLQRAVPNVDISPCEPQQLVLGDEFSCAADRVFEDGEGLRREGTTTSPRRSRPAAESSRYGPNVQVAILPSRVPSTLEVGS
jgi:hypothetical protein